MSGSSYYSHNDLRLHFGLGDAAQVDKIEMAWPSGLKEFFEGVPANHLIVIQEGKGILRRERFSRRNKRERIGGQGASRSMKL